MICGLDFVAADVMLILNWTARWTRRVNTASGERSSLPEQRKQGPAPVKTFGWPTCQAESNLLLLGVSGGLDMDS